MSVAFFTFILLIRFTTKSWSTAENFIHCCLISGWCFKIQHTWMNIVVLRANTLAETLKLRLLNRSGLNGQSFIWSRPNAWNICLWTFNQPILLNFDIHNFKKTDTIKSILWNSKIIAPEFDTLGIWCLL